MFCGFIVAGPRGSRLSWVRDPSDFGFQTNHEPTIRDSNRSALRCGDIQLDQLQGQIIQIHTKQVQRFLKV